MCGNGEPPRNCTDGCVLRGTASCQGSQIKHLITFTTPPNKVGLNPAGAKPGNTAGVIKITDDKVTVVEPV